MLHFWLRHRGTTFPVPIHRAVLGRSASHADIVLAGERVSRRHASVQVVDGALWLEDLGSRNGTLVNGQRITSPTRLEAGDVVNIGEELVEVSTRMATDFDDTLDDEEFDDDIATVTERSAIGLVEELVAHAVETGQRAVIAHSVREMIDAIADVSNQTGRPLGRKESVRLAAAGRVVAGWVADGSLDGWSRDLAARLSETEDPFSP